MFWDIRSLALRDTAVLDGAGKTRLKYPELADQVEDLARALLDSEKLLVLLLCDNSFASIIGYLSALNAGHAVMLLNNSTHPKLLEGLSQLYSPDFILSPNATAWIPSDFTEILSSVRGLRIARRGTAGKGDIHPDTGVLLSTSGTTGSPKFIRLSYQNLQANAASIVQYLGISARDRAITSLPMSYSYGLSVINSHLLAGADVVFTNSSVVGRDFWSLFKETECTSFAGVPFTYAMLEKLKFGAMELPSLRVMTQAGGRLPREKVQLFAEVARKKGIRFYVMYGQTEATARISYVPWDRLQEKIGSVGIAIPGGRLSLECGGDKVLLPNTEGEIVYEGPNVMLGYAESRACLTKGDECGGRLRTGDLGYRDEDGFFYITGRLKRFVKVFGLRLNLDEVEKMLESALGCQVACLGQDEVLHIVIETEDPAYAEDALRRVSELYKLHHSAVSVRLTSQLEVGSAGKKDYKAISRGLK